MDKYEVLKILSKKITEKYEYRLEKSTSLVMQSIWWISLLHKDIIINNDQIDEIAESIFKQIENDEIG